MTISTIVKLRRLNSEKPTVHVSNESGTIGTFKYLDGEIKRRLKQKDLAFFEAKYERHTGKLLLFKEVGCQKW